MGSTAGYHPGQPGALRYGASGQARGTQMGAWFEMALDLLRVAIACVLAQPGPASMKLSRQFGLASAVPKSIDPADATAANRFLAPSPIARRSLLAVAVGAGAALAATSLAAAPRSQTSPAAAHTVPGAAFGLEADSPRDQTKLLQSAIDQTAARGQVLALAPGRYITGALRLPAGTRIAGVPGATLLSFAGGGTFLDGQGAAHVDLSGLVLDGVLLPLAAGRSGGLIRLAGCRDVHLSRLTLRNSPAHAIVLESSAGRIAECDISAAAESAIFSLDAKGLEITGNTITDCANNGILVWRSAPGEDGTLVSGNRIERIAATNGGSGQNGNGINVYRAGKVLVTGNRIADCAYSAIRGNAASNIQMVANSASRIGEVALYAEFGFEGALIASNLIDGAAAGISVTNFNEGGRLAVIQGNIIRNLRRREHEPEDKRGEGIGVEADAAVTGNVIENAPTCGIVIGWGRYMREVVATGNLIRQTRIGIAISGDPGAGACHLANNMISGASEGAIRAMSHWTPISGDLTRIDKGRPAGLTLAGNVGV